VSQARAGLDFRDMTEADVEEGLRLSRASGWNQTVEDWRLLLALGPGLFRVAVQDGRVVASGGAVCYGDALAWICMILVEPEARGRGLGTRIFDEVLVRCEAEVRAGRLRCVGLDATPAGHGIYAQRGFVDASSPGLVRMRAEPTATERKGSGLELCSRQQGTIQDLTPLSPSDLEAVLSRDREVFGADRSPVLRWAFGAAPGLACVVREAGRVRGYCFGRHGDHSDQVGPVVADDAALARDLVLACLSRPRSRPLVLDARVEPAWLATLGELGFREQRPFTRMYWGDARLEARPALEPVVFGPEFG
jgi:GNAT superfamily N-acetyltransferase